MTAILNVAFQYKTNQKLKHPFHMNWTIFQNGHKIITYKHTEYEKKKMCKTNTKKAIRDVEKNSESLILSKGLAR